MGIADLVDHNYQPLRNGKGHRPGLLLPSDKAKLDSLGLGSVAAVAGTTPVRNGAGDVVGNLAGNASSASSLLGGTTDGDKLHALATINSVTAPLTLGAGVLTEQASSATQNGYMAAADKKAFDALGTLLEAHRTTNLLVAAATLTVLISVTLSEGTWLVQGWVTAFANQGVASSVDAAVIGISDNYGNLALPVNGTGVVYTGINKIVIAAGTTPTYSLQAYASGAFTALFLSPTAGSGNNTAIVAIRIK